MIDVVLPGSFRGERIIAEFARAATFQSEPAVKWTGREIPTGYEYHREGGLVLAQERVRAYPLYLLRKFITFGPREWSIGTDASISLNPINLNADYETVQVSVWARSGEGTRTTEDPTSETFAPHRRFLDIILNDFTFDLINAKRRGGE